MNEWKIHTAKLIHRCDECGKVIPIGHCYWRQYQTDDLGKIRIERSEHTNCELYNNQPAIDSADLWRLRKAHKRVSKS